MSNGSQWRMPAVGDAVAQRYQVGRVLGEGGFATVYLATDLLAGGNVALKVLDPSKSANATFVERFRQEVAVVRKLTHHNTIKIWDVGSTEQGCLFMAMEVVQGEPLDDLIVREGALATDRVVRIVSQILRSLDEAHEHGIIHRDLKPANVMVGQPKGEPDYVKVLDFGIAKALAGEVSLVKTQTGILLCTPTYASPELLLEREITPASDLYALGLMMIEMLSGEPAVTGDSMVEVLGKQASPDPIAIPPQLAHHPLITVVSRAVQKNVSHRYQSAEVMLGELLSVPAYAGGPPMAAGGLASPHSYQGPAPSYQGPAPSYQGPAPSYQGPAPSYQGPAPSYQGPAPSYQGPAPSYQGPAPSYHGAAPSYQGPAPSYQGPAPGASKVPVKLPLVVLAGLAIAGAVTAVILLAGDGESGATSGHPEGSGVASTESGSEPAAEVTPPVQSSAAPGHVYPPDTGPGAGHSGELPPQFPPIGPPTVQTTPPYGQAGSGSRPDVTIGRIDVSGALTGPAVREQLSQHQRGMLNCYDETLQLHPRAQGRIVVNVHISQMGAVSIAQVMQSDMPDTLARCITLGASRLRFPPLRGVSATATFALRFGLE